MKPKTPATRARQNIWAALNDLEHQLSDQRVFNCFSKAAYKVQQHWVVRFHPAARRRQRLFLGCLLNGKADSKFRGAASFEKYIMSQLQNKPDQKIVIFYGFACHGIAENGKQTVLVNTFNKSTGFYRFWPVEINVRDWASKYHNSYHVAFFACCHEPYDSSRHRGFFGSKEEALQHHEK